ncbi:tyrosine recombinase XerC [Thiomicrorhabdus lithotrophica]|uniref:Tyrosine recombinase XerC n=1 Tax=Thiomicrorhabdus lithotrophica TaxID=2949997 RepID=A0ABY8CAW4_9GAMM|nr:tyrosine recombinase XerC [Thiomicrorhabdus lithotrophica]WEJ63114.1 tyrosine recombinase XerC [Thiomicrorhabdus lithotrophica]
MSLNALENFIRHLQAQNKSMHTVSNYQRDIEDFLGFYLADDLGDVDSDKPEEGLKNTIAKFSDWRIIDSQSIRAFLAYRVQNGISARTLARQLSAIRSFYDYLLLKNLVSKNPAKGVKAPKQPQPLPKSVDVDWMSRLLDQPLETWQDVRDQAIFELLYSAGLRVSECAELDLSPGLDESNSGWVRVLGKGQKERLAPVGSKALLALKNWLAIRNEYAQADEQAVFVNQRGGRLSVRSLQNQLDKRTIQAGLPTKMSPHRLRHACATHVLESSGDLRAVQEILGHANLSTTQIYTKLDLQHLAQVYDKAHPRAKKIK